MKITPKSLKRLLRLYPPYLGAGVRVEYISEDWKELHVSMSMHWYNRNAFGTHFGGSLYSMIDPHLALLLVQLLGKEYIVWDKSSHIEFIKASKKKVTSVIRISDEELNTIRKETERKRKYLPTFTIFIKDPDGELVARVEKELYVRRKMAREE